jgi:hypothetical protein
VDDQREFRVGDRVKVAGGYDMEPAWLAGGPGYTGRIKELEGNRAAVKLEATLSLRAPGNGWADFGRGEKQALGQVRLANGDWLALALAYEDAAWREPITRLHAALCAQRPDLAAIPEGGGIGIWVESHATMSHV